MRPIVLAAAILVLAHGPQLMAVTLAPAAGISSPQATPRPRGAVVARHDVAPGIVELRFFDGSTYRGSLRDGVPHGHGEFRSGSFRYDGDFDGGRMQGLGIYEWKQGDRYEGTFRDDAPDGRGRFTFADGATYDGEVKHGAMSGRGRYQSAGGDVYEGAFVRGQPEGTGTVRFANGDRYEGALQRGALDGYGRY